MRRYLFKETGHMKQDKSRRFMIPVAIVVATCILLTTGCMGNMGLTQKVKKGNLSVTENRWGREGIFLGLSVLRVNTIAALLDLVVFNSIEFWSGTNPLTKQSALVNVPQEKLEIIFGEKDIEVLGQIQRINDTEAEMYLAFANGDKMTFDVVRSSDTYSVSYLGRQFYTGQINETILSKEGS
jgi:hypothetical protein